MHTPAPRIPSGRYPAQAGGILLPVLWTLIAVLALLLATRVWLGGETELATASVYPRALAVPEFSLQRADGEPFTRGDLEGRPALLFFGFTHCPDICPTTLQELATATRQLERMRLEQLPRVVFVGVDPERDRAAMDAYTRQFHPDFIAVTAGERELRALTEALGIYYALGEPDARGDYPVDHSGSVLIVDTEARIVGRFPPGSGAEPIAADLFELARDGL